MKFFFYIPAKRKIIKKALDPTLLHEKSIEY